MESELQDFEEFMKLRTTIAQAYINGDAEPLARISSRDLPGTFFGPAGDYELGAEEVLARYKRDARNFLAGDTTLEILETGASGELAYWIGFQRASVKLKEKDGVIPMSLRVTEIFHRDKEGWKLIHRHADFLKDTSAY